MQCFAFFSSYALLLTIVGSNHIDEEIHSEAFKSKLWPTDHTLTRKLDDDDSLSDSMMSPFYRVILPNEMLPKQDQDSIQALYGKKKNAIATVRPSRHVRSIKAKKKKKKKTQKTTTINTQETTTVKGIKMTDERQLVTFEASEQARIVQAIKGLQSGGALTTFKNLSETIKIATGMLPDKFIPVLQKLSASYSTTTKTIKVGFADSCATLSKFVIKSWRVIQRGMNKEDENTLITLGKQLNTDFKNELAKFVDLSRNDLVKIYAQLLLETAGDKIEILLKQRDALEGDLLQVSARLTNKTSECAAIQGTIESIKYEQQIYNIAIRDSQGAKLEMKAEIDRLKKQLPDYEKKVQQHRDTRYEERKSFWIFSWKVRDVHIDNGERIARENLNRTIERIRVLEEKLKRGSSDFNKKIKKPTASLSKYETRKNQLEKERTEIKNLYDQTDQKFHGLIQRIDAIYRSTGTANVKSITAVDELCRALQIGSEALISACEKIRTHLATIDLDPNSLVVAVLDALQLINMADEYNDSTKIKDIKRVLGLE